MREHGSMKKYLPNMKVNLKLARIRVVSHWDLTIVLQLLLLGLLD
jgi:hypothetical protein